MLMHLSARLRRHLERRRAANALQGLSPRLLADIGQAAPDDPPRQSLGMVHALAPDLLRHLPDPAPLPRPVLGAGSPRLGGTILPAGPVVAQRA